MLLSKISLCFGLCIAQEIVHMHKGKIRVEDTPGGGTTFVVMLS